MFVDPHMSAEGLAGAELALAKPMVVKGVAVYKVLAGDTTLASYNEAKTRSRPFFPSLGLGFPL